MRVGPPGDSQDTENDISIDIGGQVTVLGTGDQPVFCTGPFAADNVVVKSNEGDLYIVNSAMLIYLNASFGSEKGAVTMQQAIQVGLGEPSSLHPLLFPAVNPAVAPACWSAAPNVRVIDLLMCGLLLGSVQSSGNLTTIYSNAGRKIMLEAVFANSMTVRTTGGPLSTERAMCDRFNCCDPCRYWGPRCAPRGDLHASGVLRPELPHGVLHEPEEEAHLRSTLPGRHWRCVGS